MSNKFSIIEQLRRNTVALISLAVAVTSLGYNTWRNEASEGNRNQRVVAIEILSAAADLQQYTLDADFGEDVVRAAVLRKGWSKALTLRDLSMIAEGNVATSAEALFSAWDEHHDELGDGEAGPRERIIAALDHVRSDTHDLLETLD